MNTLEEYVEAFGHPDLEAILREWIRVMRKYREETRCTDNKHGDVPWWYHERAQIGFLAAAAWQSGGIALEEWRMDKHRDDGEKSAGRCDLWFQRTNYQTSIEAKHLWLFSLEDTEEIIRQLDVAARDAGRHARENEPNCLGMLTIAPILKGDFHDFDAALESWVSEMKALRGETERVAIAWLFPAIDRTLEIHKTERRPGILLLLVKAKPISG